jgi:hypothetical protein
MMRHRLVAAINDQLKPAEVREMVLRVGEIAVVPAPPPTRPTPPSGDDPGRVAEVEKALAPLGDAPFRDALRQLWLRAAREPASSPAPTQKHEPR